MSRHDRSVSGALGARARTTVGKGGRTSPEYGAVDRKRAAKGAPQDLLAVLRELQSDFSADFQTRFAAFLAAEDKNIRPPHEPTYYPCGFSDCLYCVVRSTYSAGLLDVTQKLEEAVRQLSNTRGVRVSAGPGQGPAPAKSGLVPLSDRPLSRFGSEGGRGHEGKETSRDVGADESGLAKSASMPPVPRGAGLGGVTLSGDAFRSDDTI